MTNATKVTEALTNEVSASFQVTPNDGAPEGAETLGGVVYKGDLESGSKAFQAVVNGVSGDIKKNFKAAIVSALEGANVVAKNYDMPAKWSDVHVPNNTPEPETIDELDAADKQAFKTGYDRLSKALAKDEKAVENRRKANFEIAETFVGVRDTFSDSHKWAMFRKMAPDAVLKEFLGKNTAGEFYRAGKLLSVDGFDADVMVPERVSGAKGVCTAYQGVLNTLAQNAVSYANNAGYLKKVGIEGNDYTRVKAVLSDMVAQDFEFNPDGIEGARNLDDGQAAMARLVLPLHLANWGDDHDTVFDVDDGKYSVLKSQETKMPVVRTLFGLEGADELAATVARELSKRIASREATRAEASVDSATREMVKEARKSATPFSEWPTDRAARHLAALMFAGWDADASGDGMAAQRARVDEILSKMGNWADAIFAENADVADILGDAEMPESVEAAEDEADAELNG